MANVPQPYQDEVDIYDLLKTLWQGKLIISAFILISLLFGLIFILSKNAVYESRLYYSIDTLPPIDQDISYSKAKVSSEFKKLFFSKKNFDKWKEENKKNFINFNDFTTTTFVNGFLMTKSDNDLLIHLGNTFIMIKTNNLSTLNDIFDYCSYVEKILKSTYLLKSKKQIEIIKKRLEEFPETYSMMQSLLNIDKFILDIKMGAEIINLQRPTLPKKLSLNKLTVLIISAILGGIIGGLVTLIRKSIITRKAI